MSEFDFDKLTDRQGTFSYKWDVSEGELPMWVADMDFESAPPVCRAIRQRAEHGIFGYSATPEEYFKSLSDYRYRRDGYRFDTEWMVYSNGVVGAISSMVRKLTTPGENVLIQAPVYNIFYNSILNNGRKVVSSDLVYEGGEYRVDFSDLEDRLKDPETSLMILCNPHNPVGKIWSREELEKIAELCHRHGVRVISDEIHCDLIAPGERFVPFASVSETARKISATCVAASKTFNLAGLQSAAVIVPDPHLRHKIWRGINTDEVGEPNCFAMVANIAAYTECDGWVDELKGYLFENRRVAETFIESRLPKLRAVKAKATYLLWIDISAYTCDSVDFVRRVREESGLYLCDGEEYGAAGRGFVRMNLATQRSRLCDGLSRLERAVKSVYEKNV